MRLRTKIALALAGSVAALFLLWSPIRAVDSALFLIDTAQGGGKSWWRSVTSPPQHFDIVLKENGRLIAGDLYHPAGRARASLVLAPGAAPRGRTEPRIVALAEGLARAGFAVLVPEMPALRRLQPSPDDVDFLADAVNALARRVGPDKARGIVAISYAVGPAVLATRHFDRSKGTAFVLGIGGYYDNTDLVRYFTTGYHRGPADTEWQQADPNPYGKWVFLRANAARVVDANDRALLEHIAMARLADIDADIGDWFGQLGIEGRRVFDVVANTDPRATERLLALLPAELRAAMARLDPARQDLSRDGARLILIHGKDDSIIPYTQSQALAAKTGERSRLYVVDSLGHVEFKGGALGTLHDLWQANMELFALRD